MKKAYRKLSIKVHPDKAAPSEQESATKKFQTLSQIYAILSDHDKRAIYDESGKESPAVALYVFSFNLEPETDPLWC